MRIKGHIVTVINEWAVSATNSTNTNAATEGSANKNNVAGDEEKKDSKNVASSLISKKFMVSPELSE